MKFKDFFALVGSILLDWRVIVTLIAMLFVMGFANFILKYKKKPRKKKEKKAAAAPAPAPKAEENKEESKEEE